MSFWKRIPQAEVINKRLLTSPWATLFLIFLAFTSGCASEPFLRSTRGEKIDASIRFEGKVPINGIPMFITVRGENTNNPVLVYLHGGPGASEFPFYLKLFTGLERYYTVVYFDQRGAGASYSDAIPTNSMNIGQFVEDTRTVIEWAGNLLGKKKVVLWGDSWGGALGFLFSGKYPELLHCYISGIPAVNFSRQFNMSYDWVMEKAKASSNREAVAELEKAGKLPFDMSLPDANDKMMVKSKWLVQFGGLVYGQNNMGLYMRYYSIFDLLHLGKTQAYAMTWMGNELQSVNLEERVPELKVPLYLMASLNDHLLPIAVTTNYYEKLVAPKKELFIFEKSGHGIHFEQPELFMELMTNRIYSEIKRMPGI